jgi:glycosyltransferase involved in cell wall biosynthesis
MLHGSASLAHRPSWQACESSLGSPPTTRDKGLAELRLAFARIRDRQPHARLLLVGDFESGDPVDPGTVASLRGDSRVVVTGFVADPAPYYHLMTVLAFPSHREGFPNVPLEAACAGVPSVGFAATGTVDAIEDGVTGRIVPMHDAASLATALDAYLGDSQLRRRHGRAARERAIRDFAPQRIWNELLNLYSQLLRSKGLGSVAAEFSAALEFGTDHRRAA